MATVKRVPLPDYWWCDEHQEVHRGRIDAWSEDHRLHLRPVYTERRAS